MEAGFSNEVAILNFLCEHVFTNEVAILNGRKVWFRESKVEIEQLECSGKYFVSSSKQSLPHYFSQLCLMPGDRKYNNRLNSNHLEPRILFHILDPSSNLF